MFIEVRNKDGNQLIVNTDRIETIRRPHDNERYANGGKDADSIRTVMFLTGIESPFYLSTYYDVLACKLEVK